MPFGLALRPFIRFGSRPRVGKCQRVNDGKIFSGAEMALMFGGTYVGALAQVATLAVIIELAKATNQTLGLGEGAFLGLVFGIGLGAFASLSHRIVRAI